MSLLGALLESLRSSSRARPIRQAQPLCRPAFENGPSVSRRTGRREERRKRQFKVWISRGQEPMFAELSSTENVSSGGARVRTELSWRPGTRVFVKPSKGKVWTRARVAYCQRLQAKSQALGLEFYRTAHRYNLTFRCIHCGKYEASANLPSRGVESENQIKARIYRVQCARCGWKGEACGYSTVRILHYQSKETYGTEGNAPLVRMRRAGSLKERCP
jgi:hypothetical protein